MTPVSVLSTGIFQRLETANNNQRVKRFLLLLLFCFHLPCVVQVGLKLLSSSWVAGTVGFYHCHWLKSSFIQLKTSAGHTEFRGWWCDFWYLLPPRQVWSQEWGKILCFKQCVSTFDQVTWRCYGEHIRRNHMHLSKDVDQQSILCLLVPRWGSPSLIIFE